MTDLIPLAIAAAVVVAVVVFIFLRVRNASGSNPVGPGGSRGRPGADKH